MTLAQGDIILYLQYLTESFYSMAQEKEIRQLFYPEAPSLIMDFDEQVVQQVIYNLLSNALRFTAKGGKIVLHATEEKQVGQSFLKLKVTDTGTGIPPEDLPRIFDRFYQMDSSSIRKRGGTGIGLALTKKLIDLMDGTIEVESSVGKGTLFTLLLPIQNEAAAQHKALQPVRTPGSVPAPSLKLKSFTGLVPEGEKPVLLLIEDNADVVFYIVELLSPSYEVVTANDGQSGIEKAFEVVPDIIISDVMMPEKNGYEVCQELKQDERSSHIPVVLLTAKATDEDRLKGLKVGADAYLVKPFHKEELFVWLDNLVVLRKSLQGTYSGASSLTQTLLTKQDPTLEDQFLKKLITVVTDRMDDPDLGVVHLCQAARLSNTQVNRKLKALTGRTPSQFIRFIRLERAAELLKTTENNISEVAYSVGFNDPNYFTRVFSEEFGFSPRGARK
jgi:CheY-like chemotaxis protein/two-component sensor histidine kinase